MIYNEKHLATFWSHWYNLGWKIAISLMHCKYYNYKNMHGLVELLEKPIDIHEV